jgi:hypothetical protein
VASPRRHAREDVDGEIVLADRHRLLADDAARVGLRHHLVQRGAGLALALQHGPVHGRPAAILRQAASRAC